MLRPFLPAVNHAQRNYQQPSPQAYPFTFILLDLRPQSINVFFQRGFSSEAMKKALLNPAGSVRNAHSPKSKGVFG